MAGDARRLVAALRTGNRAGARRAWLAAYDRYLRIGAAYGALGDLDQAIDGLAGEHPGGARDPRFTGLHRVEAGLWSDDATRTTLPWAARLARDVDRLPAALRHLRISPLDYATRAHEILEDAQRDMLSGVDAPWSGAGLRATADSLAATEFVVKTLKPLLNGRGGAIEPVENELTRFRADLERVRHDHGGEWPRLEALSQAQHERVDGGLGSLLQRLDDIPGALEVKRSKPVPTIAEQARLQDQRQ
jgi:iron uptake system EfeUOB component EfeO/EfeM